MIRSVPAHPIPPLTPNSPPPALAAALRSTTDHRTGTPIHALILKTQHQPHQTFLHNALLTFYFSASDPASALKVFDVMPHRTIVSHTALVTGLLASSRFAEAKSAFEAMPERNVVAWTSMIRAYAHGRPEEAFEMYRRMVGNGIEGNEFTVVALAVAGGELGSLAVGRWVHELARASGYEDNVFVGTALVDMYSNCGNLNEAVKVFEGMRERSAATWNSMITSFGVHGFGREAVEVFRRMETARVMPDGITLKGVLCGCLGEGMGMEGLGLFGYLLKKYGVVADENHWKCLRKLERSAAGSQVGERSGGDLEKVLNGAVKLEFEEQKQYMCEVG